MLGLFFKKKELVEFKAPVSGETVELTALPDEVFAGKLVGDGIAFKPDQGVLYAPVSGEIIQVFPTKHAIGLRTKEGLEVLIHIGLDTVEMKGEGFKSFIQPNHLVKAGDKLMEFDLNLITGRGKSILTPMIITNMTAVKEIKLYHGKVTPGTKVMEVKI